MTVDDALYEMELVGHDFFLFHDKESDTAVRGLPPACLRLRTDPARLIARLPGVPNAVTGMADRSASPRMGDAEDFNPVGDKSVLSQVAAPR